MFKQQHGLIVEPSHVLLNEWSDRDANRFLVGGRLVRHDDLAEEAEHQ